VSKYCKKCGDKLKERASPSQIETCIVRISKVSKEILQKEVDKNESSIADELDKKLGVEVSNEKE
jgi:hypothetical protein